MMMLIAYETYLQNLQSRVSEQTQLVNALNEERQAALQALEEAMKERKAVDTFKYLDLSREYTENQKFVNEQLSKGIRNDMADVRDSLAVFTGHAYIEEGVVIYKE